jgi:outer membrane translocation and assembly module TamA
MQIESMVRLTLIKSWCAGAVIGAALYGPAAFAQGEGAVYRCKDANGTTMFTNNPGNAKNCEKMQIQSVSTIPAPKLPAARNGSAATPTPANFPRVDTAQQKARDEGRRDLLEEELAKTEAKCNALKKDYNNGEPERQGNERNYVKYQERVAKMKEDVARCDADITALKKEIALVK